MNRFKYISGFKKERVNPWAVGLRVIAKDRNYLWGRFDGDTGTVVAIADHDAVMVRWDQDGRDVYFSNNDLWPMWKTGRLDNE